MSRRLRDFVSRPLETSHHSGWRWYLAVARRWRWWLAFWLIFLVADIWWLATR